MPPARRRVSYVIPPPGDNVPRLQLPPHAHPRNGATGPLLVQARGKPDASNHHLSKGPHHPRHRLGVACLALDTSTQLVGRSNPDGILYSGGRDGLVLSWDLGIKMKRRSQRYGVTTNAMQRNIGRWEIMTGWNDIIEEDPDEGEEPIRDGDVLGEVKGAGARGRRRVDPSIPFEHQWETDIDAFEEGKTSQFRQCVQIHSDWVNDILLCNLNQTVVTASSDGTVKAWSPHTQSEPTTIGSHADYVRCLAHCYNQSWVASGSFDRTIKLWDLGNPPSSNKSPLITLTAPESSGPKASVYALATDPYGSVVVSGSPERVIRMWDPRSGKRVGKLVGHTDNIRAILLSDDSRYLLTGSADASIKLWSLSSQRCLHTFTHHTESVWSLFSQHPSLEIFYSGDRSGLVCKVDVENCTDVAEGECIVICQDSGTCNNTSNNNCGPNVNGGTPGNGESTAGFIPCNEGVSKIVAMDDNLLWTASGSSCIRRWKVPARRAARAPHYSSSMVGLGLGGGGSITSHNEVESPTQSESGNSPVELHPSHFPSSTSTSTNAPVPTTTTSATLSPPSPPFGRRSLELGNRSRTPPLGVTFRSSSPSHPSQPTGIPRRGHRTSITASVAGSDHYSIIQDHDQDNEREEKTSYGIPYDSLVRLTSPNEGLYPQPLVGFMTSASLVGLGPMPGTATSGNFGYSGTMGTGAGGRGRDPEIATLYSAASVMSVPRVVRSPLQAIFPNMNQPRPTSPFYPSAIRVGSGEGETLHPLKTPQMLYEEREVAADATPLYSEPDDIIYGEHGLVRSIILNDRIHVLTVDTRGEVAVWNIVRGVCLGKYKAEDVSDATFYGSSKGSSNGSAGANSGSGERGTSPREALETVRERIEGEAVVISWCSVDTKTGVLTVHLNERCFDAEIYADEAGYADRQFSDELRLNIGKWVLRSVFINFIREETRSASRRHRSTTSTSSSSSHHHDSHHHHIHRSAAPAHIDIRGHSPETRRRSSSDVSGSSMPTPPRSASIVTSPNMLPAVAPIITNLGKSPSPLHTPSIPISALSRNGESLSSQLTPIPQSPFLDDAMTPMPLAQIAEGVPATPATKENDYFTQRARKPSVSAASTGAPATPDDFSGWGGPGSKPSSTAVASTPDSNVPQTPSTPGGRFMGRLMSFGRGGKGRQDSEPGTVASVPGQSSSEGAATREQEPIFPKTPLQVMLSGPLNPPPSSEAPSIPIPINTSIVISEEAPSGWKTIYRGHVSSTGHDKALLEEAMPLWLLEYLLINKAPSVPINKVSFVLLPCKDTNGEQLPELLNTQQAKLTASRFLRVRKLTHHVQDKLDKIAGKTQGGTPRSSYDRSAGSTTGSKPERTKPEDCFEILCNDSVLPLDMTLAARRGTSSLQGEELFMAQVARISSGDIRSPTVPSSRGASADGHAEVEHVTAEAERRSEEFMDVEASGQNLKQKNPTNYPHAFLSPELANARRVYILHIVKTIFGIVILMWLTLPAFWGALYNSAKSTGNLEAWFIDRDDSRIGHAIWEGFSNSTSGMQLGWVPIDAAAAGTNEEIINSIVQNKAWIAVVIEANATSNLAQARQNGDLTYDPKNAITVYYAQARNEVANGNYVIPLATQLLESTVVAWATSSAQRYFAQITPGDTANATAVHNLALAPQTISPGISWRIINLRPYTAPTAQAVTLVGNIFLCIFAFMITMSNTHARTLISPRLTISSYIRVRIIIPLLAYIPLSLSYTLVSLAFGLPFGAKYSKAGGFFLAFVYFYLGMAALGLSLEAMITILTPVFTPFFLFTLIIYNVAPVLLPSELQSPFFSYGLGFPVLNLSQAVRTIFFNTQSTLGRNAGVMIGWILLSCLTVAAFTFIMQRREHVSEVNTYDSYPKSAVVEVQEKAKK